MDNTVFLLKISGDYGDTTSICESEDVAYNVLLKWVKSMWSEEDNGKFPEATPHHAVGDFFERSAEYYYDLDELVVIRGGMEEAQWDT